MTDILALIGDSQSETHFHGVLICKRIVPNRLHWFVLENHDLTLARGSIECDRHTLSAQECVNVVVKSVARKIGIDVGQIQIIQGSVTPVVPQGDYIASMIEIDSTPAEVAHGRHLPVRAPQVCLNVPVRP